jgi:hypothetical protein
MVRRKRAGEMGVLMNKRETFEPAARKQDWRALLAILGPVAGIGSVISPMSSADALSNLDNYPFTICLFGCSAR